jgi:hypothetical protein
MRETEEGEKRRESRGEEKRTKRIHIDITCIETECDMSERRQRKNKTDNRESETWKFTDEAVGKSPEGQMVTNPPMVAPDTFTTPAKARASLETPAPAMEAVATASLAIPLLKMVRGLMGKN